MARLALDAFVWTGEGSPTLEQRRKKLPEFLKSKRRPIDRAFVRSIFERDHPDCADSATVEAFADAILALDSSMPNGTYIDMCSKLPVVDPLKITVPTIVMRGQFDGIAGMGDLLAFFHKLPNPDKQFSVMAGISHAELPAEELPAGLPRAARVLLASEAGVHGRRSLTPDRLGFSGARLNRPTHGAALRQAGGPARVVGAATRLRHRH